MAYACIHRNSIAHSMVLVASFVFLSSKLGFGAAENADPKKLSNTSCFPPLSSTAATWPWL